MPMIVPMVISMTCNNAYSNHTDACNKALEAGSRQSGMYDGSEKVENYLTDHAKDGANDYLGKPVTYVIGGAGYTYKVYKDKAVNFKLPNIGLCDSVTNKITPTSYTLNLKWNLW